MLTVGVVTSSQVLRLALSVAGTPYHLVHRSDHAGTTQAWSDLGGWTLDVIHDFDLAAGQVRWGDGRPATTAGVTRRDDGTSTVVDPTGRRYQFDEYGRHLTTDHPVTGLLLRSIRYATDGTASGVVEGGQPQPTVIVERAADGSIVLVAADGRRTTLTRSPEGWLTGVTNPAGGTFQIVADADGRVCTVISPEGRTTTATYDADGRLVREDRPGGGGSTLWRTRIEGGTKVLRTTGTGVEQSSLTSALPDGGGRIVMGCCGDAKTTTTVSPDGSRTVEYADGSIERTTDAGGATMARSTPSGIEARRALQTSFAAAAGGSGWVSEAALTLDSSTVSVTTDSSSRSRTVTSPSGRWRRFTYDESGRVMRVERWGLEPVDVPPPGAHGRPPWEDLDALDRVTCARYPDGTGESYEHDADSRVTSLTRPSGAQHTFDRDLDGNLVAWHTPAGGTMRAERDADGRITSMHSPAGRVLRLSHATTGSLQQVVGGDGTDGATTIERDHPGRLVILRHADPLLGEQAVSYAWDGSLPTGVRWSGLLEATAIYRHGAGWRLEGITVDGDPEDVIAYDADGLTIADGPFRIERDAASGTARTLTDGHITVVCTYDGTARLVSREHRVGETAIYRIEVVYDAEDRVAQTSETIEGIVVVRRFEYDPNGQMVQVRDDTGRTIERYVYDVNGNPIQRESRGRNRAFGFNDADHLVSGDGSAVHVDADGIAAVGNGGPITHGSWSELREAPGARYAYDGFGTRVAQQSTEGFRRYLHADPRDGSRLSLVIDPAGNRTRYRHAAGTLVAVDRDGRRYSVGCDLVGTPRVVADADGQIVKIVERDSFGALVTDSAPTWVLDVGFAGGIDDPATGRVRFGLRDYDPSLGRWTTADPAGFLSRDRNLWRYCRNNPVSLRDPAGTDPVATTGTDGGASFNIYVWLHEQPNVNADATPEWQDYDGPTADPGSVFDPLAGDTTPSTGVRYIPPGWSTGGYGFQFGGRRCQASPGSGNIFPYPATPQYPGMVDYTDFGLASGPSGGGKLECYSTSTYSQ